MMAALNGHNGVVRRLLELGVDHTAVATGGNWEGKVALELAQHVPENIFGNERSRRRTVAGK